MTTFNAILLIMATLIVASNTHGTGILEKIEMKVDEILQNQADDINKELLKEELNNTGSDIDEKLQSLQDTLINKLDNIICKQGTSCPDKFVNIKGCCYYFSIDNGDGLKSWHEASTACQDKGQNLGQEIYLAEVGTVDACNDVIFMEEVASRGYRDPLGGGGIYWFGATDMELQGKWLWQSGGGSKYFSKSSNMWLQSQPQGHEKCLFAWIRGTDKRAYFEDAVCNEKYHYICQLF